MAYRDEVPIANKIEQLGEMLLASGQDTRLAFAIDSKATEAATGGNARIGSTRRWRPASFSGVMVRSYSGPPGWNCTSVNNNNSATVTTRSPGDVFSGGQSKLAPIVIQDNTYTGDIPNLSGTAPTTCLVVDRTGYAIGDPWSGQQATARQLWWRDANMVASMRIRAVRNTGTDSSWSLSTVVETAQAMTGAAGWQYTEVNCGAGAGSPGVLIVENSANETGKQLYPGPRAFYRGTPGARSKGLFLGDIAVGGYNMNNFLRSLGGDGANATCTVPNLIAFLQQSLFMCGAENTGRDVVWVDGWQNRTAGTSTETGNGVQTQARAEAAAVIDQLNSVWRTANAGTPLIVMVNTYDTGYTQLQMETVGRVLYGLSRDYGNVLFLDQWQAMPLSPLSTSWVTGNEDIHPTGPNLTGAVSNVGNGAEVWMGNAWDLMVAHTRAVRMRYAPPRRAAR